MPVLGLFCTSFQSVLTEVAIRTQQVSLQAFGRLVGQLNACLQDRNR